MGVALQPLNQVTRSARIEMDYETLAIPEVILLKPKAFRDERGFFCETYNRTTISRAGITADFCQDNFSYSARIGTVRGLHFQAPPYAQAKLVRVTRGSVVDVAVDARRSSPTFGKWVKAELSASNMFQLFIPRGFLHGFITVEDETEVAYKVDAEYNRESDGSVLWNDPDLSIDWGLAATAPVLSEKDRQAETWANFDSPFD